MSHSEKRARQHFVGMRLLPDEWEQLDKWRANDGYASIPEMLRHWLFGYRQRPRGQCSQHHPTCSTQHMDMVQGYRLARHQEELDLEAATGLQQGDLEHWRATGGKLITFHQWLKGQTTEEEPSGDQEAV